MRRVRPVLELRPRGRGRGYAPARGFVESALRVVYRGGWPARLWSAVGPAARVRLVRVSLPLLAEGTPELRLGFVSDLHLGPTTSERTVDAAFRLLEASRPDVLLLGGDFIFLEATARSAEELSRRVAGVPARLKLAVLGNHDLWGDDRAVERALVEAGARVLVNEGLTLPPPHGSVAIAGLDDPMAGAPDGARAFAKAAGARTRVAFCHSPDGLDEARAGGAALLLAGHTHGGHCALPGGRPLVVPCRVGRRYPHGVHDAEGITIVVSRGVGGIEVPVRTFAPPDVAVVTLHARAAGLGSPSSRE